MVSIGIMHLACQQSWSSRII